MRVWLTLFLNFSLIESVLAQDGWMIIVSPPEVETQAWWAAAEKKLTGGQPYIHIQLPKGPLSPSGEMLLEEVRQQCSPQQVVVVGYEEHLSHRHQHGPKAWKTFDKQAMLLRQVGDVLGCQKESDSSGVSLWYYHPRYHLIPIPHTPKCAE